MSWIFIAAIFLIYAGGLAGAGFMLFRKRFTVERQRLANLEIVRAELQSKKEILMQLAQATQGLATPESYEKLGSEIAALEEKIRAEKGRLTITEAELEAIDIRLRELEELKRELEVSNMDAVKELDMLRSQERDIKAKNEALRNQVKDSMDQVDMLLSMLSSNAEAVERLTRAKNEMLETEKKTEFFADQITQINANFMTLKRAYDALDIEYAQLYEKQQAAAED